MCGILGLLTREDDIGVEMYNGLTVLQHRGQDAAGMAVCSGDGQIHLHKGSGLVRDVFPPHRMERMRGQAGVGHVRYPTSGSPGLLQAQPMYINQPYGMSAVHNGNIVNHAELRRYLTRECRRHMASDSDSELILNLFAQELSELGGLEPEAGAITEAALRTMQRLQGSYTVIVLISGFGLLAFRDRLGIRPLVLGTRYSGLATSYMVASESAALEALDYRLDRDVQPGEAMTVDLRGNISKRVLPDARLRPCIFEWVYLARPDSVIDGASVYRARLNMGERLAHRVREKLGERMDIDVVVPVPECSTTSALQLAETLGLPYREGLVKNRYIGRTFIMGNQSERGRSVRNKLTAVRAELAGKSVLLVDDSVVRGTTSSRTVALVRQSGAKKVYLASAAPPIRFPNVFGIDMPVSSELIAHNQSEDEVAASIGADALVYQRLEDLVGAVVSAGALTEEFETSIFDGEFPVPGVDEDYLRDLAARRNDGARSRQRDIFPLSEPALAGHIQ